ncbi:MAG: I78 family peptidase inhibitor [Sphingobium sp.]
MARTGSGMAWLTAGIALLAGCAADDSSFDGAIRSPASPASAPSIPASPIAADLCDAAPTQARIGTIVSQEAGVELLRLTGARQLRWLGPGMAATMDFRPDRLTVTYDDNRTIVRIACG